jgi:uncharacterized protein YndB with AHSA1/START domain
MSERNVTHATFAVERSYAAPPARVFEAWADPAAKSRWFGGDNWQHELDFRVGGREVSTGTVDGTVFTFEGRYQDIVPHERIVYAYDVRMGEARISVSLATVELSPDGEGTKLAFTEQGAFLDGLDDPSQRESGTGSLLDALGKELER